MIPIRRMREGSPGNVSNRNLTAEGGFQKPNLARVSRCVLKILLRQRNGYRRSNPDAQVCRKMPEVIALKERCQSLGHEIPILPPILLVDNGAGPDFRRRRST